VACNAPFPSSSFSASPDGSVGQGGGVLRPWLHPHLQRLPRPAALPSFGPHHPCATCSCMDGMCAPSSSPLPLHWPAKWRGVGLTLLPSLPTQVATGLIGPESAYKDIDHNTLAFLFGMMALKCLLAKHRLVGPRSAAVDSIPFFSSPSAHTRSCSCAITA